MKKLITLLLVLTGCVMTAMATDIYVCVDNLSWWNDNVCVVSWGGTAYDEHDYTPSDKLYIGGRTWYKYTVPNNNTTAQVRRYYYESETRKFSDYSCEISAATDCYVMLYNEKDNNNYKYNYWTSIQSPKFRNNIVGGWADQDMTKVDDNTYTYELSKTDIGANSDIWFRIWYWDTQLYRKNDADRLSLPGSTSDYNLKYDESAWGFGIPVPTTYDFDKIVVTIQSSSTAAGYTVSADAYIAKVVGANLVATFGSGADVDFTDIDGLTAQKLKVNTTNGKLDATDCTTLKAGEGAYLTATTAKTYYIPVAASASADTEHNDLKAITSTSKIDQTSGDNTRYILSIVDEKVGFYKVNTNGSWCGAGTAYLETPYKTASGSRPAFFFDDETTGIEAVNVDAETVNEGVREYYNLNGQRVANPSKGLYIVNGKKVIIK